VTVHVLRAAGGFLVLLSVIQLCAAMAVACVIRILWMRRSAG
jgi:hypothetical protein